MRGTSLAYVFVALVSAVILPAGGTRDEGRFSFAIASDASRCAGPGRHDTPKDFRGVCEAIAKIGRGAFMISPGDMEPPDESKWTIEKYLGPHYPWYLAVGNHEKENPTFMAWMRAYNRGGNTLPNVVNAGPPGCRETTYSFDYKNCHFVIINEYYDGSSDTRLWGDIKHPLYRWLEADLSATTKQHIFVIGHEPAYVRPDAGNGLLRHLGDSLDAHPQTRDSFWSLLGRKNVVAYITGHTHTYSAAKADGVWQLNTGHSRGKDERDAQSTFVIVNVNGGEVAFDTYRDNGDGGPYLPRHHSVLVQGTPALQPEPAGTPSP